MNDNSPARATGAPVYSVARAQNLPATSDWWESPAWSAAAIAEVSHFRPESSTHRPRTLVRLLRSDTGLHGIFRVHDRFVRATRTGFMSEVWKDSCVEFFVQPKPGGGYFNFEMNCGGAWLCCYVTDPTRLPGGALQGFMKLPAELGRAVTVHSTLPAIVDPELTEATCWELQFSIPWTVLETFVGPLNLAAGQCWRGNFFKCAEENSHPHWASWAPVDEFNFHVPRCFGAIEFA